MNWEIITAPAIGAGIGLLTNWLAIKMLFRPWKPVYIGKFRVPFTPGLIPKEKPRLAKAISRVVGNNLLDSDTIKKHMLSDETKEKLMSYTDTLILSLSESEKTLADYLTEKNLIDFTDKKSVSISDYASVHITDKLIKEKIGTKLLDYGTEELIKNMNPMISGIASKALNSAHDSIVEKIDALIVEKSPELINELLSGEYSKFKNMLLKDFFDRIIHKFPDYKERIWSLWTKLSENYLDKIVKSIDIQKIVEDKINEYELPELEKLIMDISKKELQALVILGGVLGMLMGFLNLLI